MWKRYLLALILTLGIFGSAFYMEYRLDEQRVAMIRASENDISIDILSSQTQFELLGNLECGTTTQSTALSSELDTLGSRLSVAENNLGSKNDEVVSLKKQYSLLEIKDFILAQQIAAKCHQKPVFVLYFYSNAGDCPDCSREGDVLTYLRQQYPALRVYAFDYHLDLSALRTLSSIHELKEQLPALIINNRQPVYGFKTLDDVEALIPELKATATSTKKTATSSVTR